MRVIAIAVPCLIVMLLSTLTSCSDANAETNLDDSRIASSILDLNYKDAVNACVFKTFDSPETERTGFTAWWLNGMEGCIGEGIPERQLTPNEKLRLGLWKLPDGSATFWSAIVTAMYVYHDEFGELPETGVDLFTDLRSPEGYEALLTMSDAEVLNLYSDGIDPMTGRFYSSFSSKQWQPGTMNVTLVQDEKEIAENYPELYIPSGSDEESKGIKRPDMVWHVIIYGEEEGSILLDDIVVM
jgi:hypothetical protein